MRSQFCGNSSGQNGKRQLATTTTKRRWCRSPVGMLKTRSSFWVRCLAAQNGGNCGFAISSEEHRTASTVVESWFCGNGKIQARCLGQRTRILQTNSLQTQKRTSHGPGCQLFEKTSLHTDGVMTIAAERENKQSKSEEQLWKWLTNRSKKHLTSPRRLHDGWEYQVPWELAPHLEVSESWLEISVTQYLSISC